MARILDETADGTILHRTRPETIQDRLVAMAVNALAGRSLVWVVALSSSGAWWWTVLHPTTLGIIASAAATLSTLLPTLWYARRD